MISKRRTWWWWLLEKKAACVRSQQVLMENLEKCQFVDCLYAMIYQKPVNINRTFLLILYGKYGINQSLFLEIWSDQMGRTIGYKLKFLLFPDPMLIVGWFYHFLLKARITSLIVFIMDFFHKDKISKRNLEKFMIPLLIECISYIWKSFTRWCLLSNGIQSSNLMIIWMTRRNLVIFIIAKYWWEINVAANFDLKKKFMGWNHT